MIIENTETPAGTKPPLNTENMEPNTLSSEPPVKKLAKFSQNFQETPSLPAKYPMSVTPKGMPTIVAPRIPKIIEPLTLSLSRIAMRNKPLNATIAVFVAANTGLPSLTTWSPQLVKSTKPTCVKSLVTIIPALWKPIYAINKPIPMEIALLTATGIPSKISSRKVLPLILISESAKKIRPDMKTSINTCPTVNLIPLPLASKNVQPPIRPPAMELRPMPDACASGIFAKKAIKSVPITAPIAVAINTDAQ